MKGYGVCLKTVGLTSLPDRIGLSEVHATSRATWVGVYFHYKILEYNLTAPVYNLLVPEYNLLALEYNLPAPVPLFKT